ncbi:hypothetical protein R3P38DRAFT_2860354 [Favolaschia claudopus]|uniref:Protein kinase domain-containing protein n=1 Tax=Favolaschia claudopus TaxID=2862362 RepID=A0AAW0DN75_9AGAR
MQRAPVEQTNDGHQHRPRKWSFRNLRRKSFTASSDTSPETCKPAAPCFGQVPVKFVHVNIARDRKNSTEGVNMPGALHAAMKSTTSLVGSPSSSGGKKQWPKGGVRAGTAKSSQNRGHQQTEPKASSAGNQLPVYLPKQNKSTALQSSPSPAKAPEGSSRPRAFSFARKRNPSLTSTQPSASVQPSSSPPNANDNPGKRSKKRSFAGRFPSFSKQAKRDADVDKAMASQPTHSATANVPKSSVRFPSFSKQRKRDADAVQALTSQSTPSPPPDVSASLRPSTEPFRSFVNLFAQRNSSFEEDAVASSSTTKHPIRAPPNALGSQKLEQAPKGSAKRRNSFARNKSKGKWPEKSDSAASASSTLLNVPPPEFITGCSIDDASLRMPPVVNAGPDIHGDSTADHKPRLAVYIPRRRRRRSSKCGPSLNMATSTVPFPTSPNGAKPKGGTQASTVELELTDESKYSVCRWYRELNNQCQETILNASQIAHPLLDLAQDVLENVREETGSVPDTKLHRLVGKLCYSSKRFPPSLSIQGVEQRSPHPFAGGGFADVYKAVYMSKPVVLKQLRLYLTDTEQKRQRQWEKLCQEALLWKTLDHPSVLPFIGLYDANDSKEAVDSIFSMAMVCPWMPNGTVTNHLKGCKSPGTVETLLLEIAQGLQYLHSKLVVHGDLKGNNVLIDDDGHARLADFGLASWADATAYSSAHAGSTRWQAPELLSPDSLHSPKIIGTYASDVYAFACVCYELYNEAPPFSELNQDSAVIWAVTIEKRRPSRLPKIPTQMWALIETCWAHEPGARPRAGEIVKIMQTDKRARSAELEGSLASPAEPGAKYKPPRAPSLTVSMTLPTKQYSLRNSSFSHLFPSPSPAIELNWRKGKRVFSEFLRKIKTPDTCNDGVPQQAGGRKRSRILSLIPQRTPWT